MTDRNPAPYDFAQAIAATRKAAEMQMAAEDGVREAARALAEAERQYRMALAQEILAAHADGKAWTVSPDLARGEKRVADLRYARDVAEGVLKAADQRAWRHSADRKDNNEFIQWSRRVAPDGQRDPS